MRLCFAAVACGLLFGSAPVSRSRKGSSAALSFIGLSSCKAADALLADPPLSRKTCSLRIRSQRAIPTVGRILLPDRIISQVQQLSKCFWKHPSYLSQLYLSQPYAAFQGGIMGLMDKIRQAEEHGREKARSAYGFARDL